LEVLSHAPFSGIFHNFFSENELEAYINIAKNNLERSEHMTKSGGAESSILRTSKQVGAIEQDLRKTIIEIFCEYY
jgi:hypothetical protein